MKPVPSTTIEGQLFGLSTLMQLVKRARNAASADELGFIMVNESHALVPYRQAILWRHDRPGAGRLIAISGVPIVETSAPFALWLGRLLKPIDLRDRSVRPIAAAQCRPDVADEWGEWLPENAVVVPLAASSGDEPLGALLFARDHPWSDSEQHLLAELADGYAHAWAPMLRRQRRSLLGRLRRRRTALGIAAAIALLAVMALPITLTALAPAEITAFEPAIVRAPLEGVVDRVLIQPNDVVTEGQTVVELDPRAIENRLEVAAKAVSVSEAEYRQAAQQAVFDDKSRAQLAILKGRMEQKRADAAYAKSLLERIHVQATRGGIALIDSPGDWIGRPVSIGERLLDIADPAKVEIEIWLPVADAITLQPGAGIDFFLNVTPDAPVRARLRQTSYQAAMSPTGVLGYRLKAELADGNRPPRIGLRGTARVHGDEVPVIYYLLRRPLAALRQLIGY